MCCSLAVGVLCVVRRLDRILVCVGRLVRTKSRVHSAEQADDKKCRSNDEGHRDETADGIAYETSGIEETKPAADAVAF